MYVALLCLSQAGHGLYVGSASGKATTPESGRYPCYWKRGPVRRYLDHIADYKAGRGLVRDYGCGLLPDLYERFNPMAYDDAVKVEEQLAAALRSTGIAVSQH